ncbi:PARP-domain-containing protein [Dichomitus squalens]|uniref:Poly [ADP-ribose] polymerase n=1 Tax=Dichomitus squalens TaxID=114155 RepID=A0A4Q9M895_9APHY|nr:PARP-domain-containing protein [Dichomitus squalens]
MPPRKKATAVTTDAVTDGATAPAPTRSSGRTRAPSAKAQAVAAASAAVANGTTGINGGAPKRGKRAREETDGETDVETDASQKPAAKKAKAGTKKGAKGKKKEEKLDAIDEEGDDEAAVEEEEEEKPTAKKARAAKAKAAPKAKVTKGKGKKAPGADDDDVDMDDAADAADAEDEEEDAKKPVSKKPASKAAKPASQKADLPQKMVTVMKRGAAPPVDARSGWALTHEVLITPEGIWDATLNQTDVGNNANKFYVLQLLHPVGNNSQVTLFTCWGRVGENGSSQKKGPWSPAQAVIEFKRQFKAKAGVDWEQRVGMVQKKGKYQWIEKSYGDDEEEEETKAAGPSKNKDEKIPDSTLGPELQQLIKLIFNQSLFAATLSSMNYDANKLPLGKLAKSTILNGFSALKTLSEVINSPAGDLAAQHGGFRKAVEDLTSRYYSVIPHVFGRDRPTVIDNVELLKRELELVDALGDMEIATQLISSSIPKDPTTGQPVNPLDANFRSLSLSRMDPVPRSSKEFKGLQVYTRDTHGATHRHYGVEVLNAFRVEREGETRAWEEKGFGSLADGERMLLWHGSRTTNFAGILKQGLRIAPPEAPVTGYMFGKGVYFADVMSKSANYCHAYLSDNIGILLLCEVAAKPFYEQHNANYNADQDCKAAGARCTKGLGRTQPAEWQDAGDALENSELKGCHMPKGPGKDVLDPKIYLQYNEYIVYDSSQIRLRYLLMVKMQ